MKIPRRELAGQTSASVLLSFTESERDKIKAKLVFDPGGCSRRLHGRPCLGRRRALLREGFVRDAKMVFEARARFYGSNDCIIRRANELVRRTLLR